MLDVDFVPRKPARSVAEQARSLPDLFLKRADLTPSATAWKRKSSGRWVASTWREASAAAASVATFLMDRGVSTGDKITIVGSTRPEWCVSDLGGLLAGAVTVGAYPTLTGEQLAYIVDHSDSRVVFVEDREQLDKLLANRASVPRLELAVVWNTRGLDDVLRDHAWILPWEDVLKTPADRARIDARLAAIKPDDTAIIVYTSGTTGPPKGAMLSHDNILTLLRGAAIVPFDEDDISLVFLPMAHVAERIVSFYGRINYGIAAAYASSIPAVLDEVKEIRPTLFGSVPRIFEKAYARIQSEVAKAPPAKQKVFRWAESVGQRLVDDWQAGRRSSLAVRLQYRLADRVVFSRLREAFGGNVRYFITGAAPTPKRVLSFFWSAGLPIYEVYGMTEATAITHANRPGAARLGSVGRVIDFAEHMLADDGEILVRGKVVFKGYYKNPEATAEMVDERGWLHTGDIGKVDANGFLHIVDRKKHIIITAGGKNLTPANIEGAIKAEDPLISQVHAHGDRRSYVTALVTLHPLEAVDWSKERGFIDAARADALRSALMSNPLARPEGLDALMAKVTREVEIRRRVVDAVRRGNAKLGRVEQVKRVYLLDRDLSLEEDEVTPTLKVKRKNVEKKFSTVFDRLYEDDTFGIAVTDR